MPIQFGYKSYKVRSKIRTYFFYPFVEKSKEQCLCFLLFFERCNSSNLKQDGDIMIRVIQRRLIIPRGDTGIFTIPAMTQAEGAIGVFTIFDPITNTRIFQKQVEIEEENFNISFSHADTVNLKAGDYLWDIKFYKNPILADNKVIDGEEINSYYAAFQAPKCEIRETGDDFLMIEGQPAKIEDLNIILGATEAANAAKDAATEQAGIAADKAEEAAARLAEMIAAIPTKVSELENDSGYLTDVEVISIEELNEITGGV